MILDIYFNEYVFESHLQLIAVSFIQSVNNSSIPQILSPCKVSRTCEIITRADGVRSTEYSKLNSCKG